MNLSTREALEKTGLTLNVVDWFVPHQANPRINEAVVQYAEIPPEKVLNTIQIYGNTTAASVPLTIRPPPQGRQGEEGQLVLSSVFGAGFTWAAAVFRI